ncbi:MAG: GspE/PulE family protein [Deltaproteobacteria bacterium]|nr:GspE/PulE family protein [Deltaproteobacteria bacterium]MBW2118259.1 GspE/PulE family protein [Deltaproteobacteria bacterium]MBW2345307.1 GspE/PulE family protein [Deltaproteobacteria bacterium]
MAAVPEKKIADSGTGKRSLEEQLEYQKKLNNITNRIHGANDINDILLNLQSEILGLFDADRITVYVVDGVKKQIISRFKAGDEVNEIRVPITNASISGYCAASGKMANILDVYDENELKSINSQLKFDKSWDQKSGFKTTQVLVAPIVYNKYLLGVIQLINKRAGERFTEEDEASVQDIAKVLGTAFFKNQKAAQKTKPTKYDYLITNNIISNKDLTEAMPMARKLKKTVESVLMSDYNVSKDDIGKSMSDFYKTRFIPYDDKMVIPGQLLKGLKVNFLRNNVFVPVAQSADKVIVTMENPNFLPARDAVKRLIKAKGFEYCVSLKEDIFEMIDLFFDVKRTEMLTDSGSIEDILGQLEPGSEEFDDEDDGVTEEDSAIVQLVNKMIVDSFNRGASDIHIEPRPGKQNAVIRIRVDGACQIYQTIPYTYKRAMVSRLKIMSDLDISERRLPQDGKIKLKKYVPLDIELRVATIPTAGQNEDVVMRILAAGEPIPLDKMGMSERDYNELISIITKPYGIALVVGPTGSGKTTTLHAALHHINKPETKIWTAEDPVEITQDGLRQVQVQPKIGFTFATAMRAFLRADPDVIMVGEMRDHETVSTGIEASLTGHLVFSTLHTNSAPETITRLLDMGMDPFNFADALLGILAQRLGRTLCKDCKEKYHPTREEFDSLARNYEGDFDALGFEYNSDFVLYRPKGCSKCANTGYKGRTGLFEVLVGTDEMKSMVQNRAKMEDLRAQAVKDGMTTLMQDGVRKICLGVTDMIQVRRVCIK